VRRGLIWSLVGIIVVAIAALGSTVAVGHSPLLGLDLRGGVQVVLQPEGNVHSGEIQQAVNIIERRVNGLGVSNSNVARQGNDVTIDLPGIKDPQAALKVLGQTAELLFRPAYCNILPAAPTSGAKGSTTPTTAPTLKSTPKALGASPLGAGSELAAYRSGLVEASGPVGQSGLVEASGPVEAGLTPTTPAVTTPAVTTPAAPARTATTAPGSPPVPNPGATPGSAPASAPPLTSAMNLTPAQAQAACTTANSATLPTTPVASDVKTNAVILPMYDNSGRWILGPYDLGGDVVQNAIVVAPGNGQTSYTVQVSFTKAGAAQFDQMAAVRNKFYDRGASPSSNPNYYQSLESIELDGVVEAVPQIQNSSYHGTAVISGGTSGFTSAQANNLALELRYGSLPVRFTPQSVQTVSASIGSDSLKAGLLAGLGGLAIVLLYMIVYYRALGLVVVVGLGVGGALLYSIITELSQSASLALTLSGVTGIIVSIGITVDSYVVYFERLKDEIRQGRTVRQSVERGFTRAFRTVLTADFVTFLAALILYLLTVGDVKGFAFMLGLSTLLDVFTAYFFIRPAVILVGRRRAFTEARFFGVARGLGAPARGTA